jgi:hypothetical protein
VPDGAGPPREKPDIGFRVSGVPTWEDGSQR